MTLSPRDVIFEKIVDVPFLIRLKNLFKKLFLVALITGLALMCSVLTYALWERLLGHEIIFRKDPLLEEAIRLDRFEDRHRDALRRYRELVQKLASPRDRG
jgi:hypothetical protein